jgi:hypothetical protein
VELASGEWVLPVWSERHSTGTCSPAPNSTGFATVLVRARWVALRARWVTLRAPTMRTRWLVLVFNCGAPLASAHRAGVQALRGATGSVHTPRGPRPPLTRGGIAPQPARATQRSAVAVLARRVSLGQEAARQRTHLSKAPWLRRPRNCIVHAHPSASHTVKGGLSCGRQPDLQG